MHEKKISGIPATCFVEGDNAHCAKARPHHKIENRMATRARRNRRITTRDPCMLDTVKYRGRNMLSG